MLALIGLLASLVLVLSGLVLVPYFTELMSIDHRPPVVGPISSQLIHFRTLYDHMTSLARNTVIFKSNTAKLVKKISLLATAETTMNLQDLLMKSTLDSIFKVGFGFDLDTLSGDKEDILSRFLMESENDPKNMNDEYLRDISLSFVIAGKDTSANTLTWFFYLLCKHPLIQEKIAEEVVSATEADNPTSVDDFALKLTEDGKSAEKDDVLPDGFKIKKGDGVGYMAYPMGRMTYIWGEDAEDFRPERWLNNGVFQPESPFKFTAFQGGPRICLGKEFAYRQMKILAAFLVYFFKFKLVDESKEVRYRTMFTLHMDKGLHLYAFPRL
ncbi:hypothetical protein L1987_24825 [Smallanthus sonchifolius]|uniref:Uncharacterized protein n=1 Tax=Smallanthus sonchifolius TaxID=185202 RepID=A0ACB9IM37_9ASTR|nr:hypothetical protein L1987_24825 [Smallanthus sonchifolius]